MEEIVCTCSISEDEFECLKHRQLEKISKLIHSNRSQAHMVDSVRLEISQFKEEYLKLKENLRKTML